MNPSRLPILSLLGVERFEYMKVIVYWFLRDMRPLELNAED